MQLKPWILKGKRSNEKISSRKNNLSKPLDPALSLHGLTCLFSIQTVFCENRASSTALWNHDADFCSQK
ncbi:unnamed protein product [Pleuronectes platessa]|uniref:Uncharacterized protein n=1 Tax=Pleuronectes platessa TaxID=8262 RepID=A0A9N7VRH4_PLEPL|nr:unnamed protein product [Pleuronectes platessa]